MHTLVIPGFVSFTMAMIALFVGKSTLSRSELLQRYSIPEPVVGGFISAAVVAIIYLLFNAEVSFTLEARDTLLLYFFAAIGLKADLRTLVSGGKPLLILTLLASLYIVLQNLIGIGTASAFGMDPLTGLMAGSISLIGGVGTTMAWAPTFEKLGVSGATEIGIACNMLGLIAACVIGGPIASYLIKRYQLKNNPDHQLDIGIAHKEQVQLDYYGVLWAWLWLNICLILGYGLDKLIAETGLQLPMFVACLIAGILLGNINSLILKRQTRKEAEQGLALISDICLGMFLTMALMGMQLWQLKSALLFISVVIALQVLLSVLFTLLVVFRTMGRDYESAVISSGFGGITLGSTATAIVNMTAVTQQHGAAHRAFIIVPLVCGFFIDIVNALIINGFITF